MEWAVFVVVVALVGFLIGCMLAVAGCSTPDATVIAHAPSEAKIEEANRKLDSNVGASATVILDVNANNPEGPAKAVISGEAEHIIRAVGKPTADDLEAARTRAELAKTDLNGYTAALATKDREVEQLLVQIGELQKQKLAEEAKMKAEADAKLATAQQEANNKLDWLTVVTLASTGGLLVLVGGFGAAALAYMHQSVVPGILLLFVGLLTVGSGSVIHEWWFKYGLGLLLLSGIAALVLMFKRTLQPAATLNTLVPTIEKWKKKNGDEAPAVNSLLKDLGQAFEKKPEQKKIITKLRERKLAPAPDTATGNPA